MDVGDAIPRSSENEVLRAAMQTGRREELVRTAIEREDLSAADAAAKYRIM